MFSGGTYEDVARWLANFLTAHARREALRAEVLMDVGDEREGRSYGVRVRLGDRLSDLVEFDFQDVAASRGRLAWCRERAERVRALVRDLAQRPGLSGAARS